jgi:surface protein
LGTINTTEINNTTNTLTDVSANANTVTTKNTTRINYLKNLDDIDGNGTDVDLTHWDVSHASNTNRAFSNAYAFNQDIGSWNVSNVTDMSRMFYNAHAVLALAETSVRVFVVLFISVVMATLECFPPRLGVTIMVY